MAYYKTLDFSKNFDPLNSELNMLKDFVKVNKEGVYYTYFIYEQIPALENS
jgi:hypothetical protein